MIYRLFVLDKRLNEWQPKGDYKLKKTAEKKARPFIEKGKTIKIVSLPTNELGIGFKIYLPDGTLYGEIIDESEYFWFVRRAFKDKDDRVFFLKDNFLEKYENGKFIMKEELYDN